MPYQRTGPMRRPTAGQQDFSVYDFSGGLNIKSAPQELADNELTQALNGYLRPDGGFESRRGEQLYNTLTPNQPVTGLFRFYQGVRGGVATTFSQTLAQCNGTLYDVDSKKSLGTIQSAMDTTTEPWSVTLASDPQGNPNANTQEAGLTSVAVICVGGTHSGPYIYDGTQVYHPSGWANARAAKWCVLVNGVVWFGGIPGFPTQVMSTGTGITPDVSFEAIAGYAVFDLGQPVTGLSVIGSGAQAMLVIGLPYGLALIYGTGPANYTVQMVPMDNDGVASGYTMVSNDNVLYFLGNNNVYSWNPYTQPSPVPFSLKVQPWIMNDPFAVGFPMNGNRTNFFGFIYYDRYHLVYSSANSGVLDTILTYDTNIQGWTVLNIGVPIICQTLINGPFDPDPAPCLVGAANGRIYTWDGYVGFTNSFWNEAVWNQAIWDSTTANNDGGANISVWVATKFFKLGEPGSVKTLHRIYPEIIYPTVFSGNATVQTDYGLESIFSATIFAATQPGALWDNSLWDASIWNSSPPARASWNAPASRIDVTSTAPGLPITFMEWNVNNWNTFPWGTITPPLQNVPGIQGEAFSMGMQSGISSIGSIWDQSLWDDSLWAQTDQLPWILSGFTGSFAQGGKR